MIKCQVCSLCLSNNRLYKFEYVYRRHPNFDVRSKYPVSVFRERGSNFFQPIIKWLWGVVTVTYHSVKIITHRFKLVLPSISLVTRCPRRKLIDCITQKKSCCGLIFRLTVSSLKGHKESFTFVSSPWLFFTVNSGCLEHGSFKHIFWHSLQCTRRNPCDDSRD